MPKISAMLPASNSRAIRYATAGCLLAAVVCGLFRIWEIAARRRASAAGAAVGSHLKEGVAAGAKTAHEVRAEAEGTSEREPATADEEPQSQTLPGALSKLEEALAARQKELDEYKAAARRRIEERGASKAAQDEEVQSLRDEISALRESVGASRMELQESQESLEKQLFELKERNARLREKIGKLAADGEKKAK